MKKLLSSQFAVSILYTCFILLSFFLYKAIKNEEAVDSGILAFSPLALFCLLTLLHLHYVHSTRKKILDGNFLAKPGYRNKYGDPKGLIMFVQDRVFLPVYPFFFATKYFSGGHRSITEMRVVITKRGPTGAPNTDVVAIYSNEGNEVTEQWLRS